MAAQCWRFLEIAEQLKKAKVAVGKLCSQLTLEFAQSGALRVKMLSWKADRWIRSASTRNNAQSL